MKDRREYHKNYYRKNKPRLAAMKKTRSQNDLDYRLKALLGTINQRCYDSRHTSYRWYGGKGIKNFLSLEDLRLLWFMEGADKMRKPSIDRDCSDQDYRLSNCHFRELSENQKRSWNNKKARSMAIRVGIAVEAQKSAG